MLKFTQKMSFVGLQSRTSKSGNDYFIATFLTSDNDVVQCMSDFFDASGFDRLQFCEVDFELSTGRYTNLKVKNVRKSK